jgi:RimJ/RimL family protein N-acetyltransferase
MTEQPIRGDITPTGSRRPVLATERPGVQLEPWAPEHRAGLLIEANDERVPRFLSDRFPHPYTETDADEWIALCEGEEPPLAFAVVAGGEVAGGIGAELHTGILGGSAELGWWLGHRFWGNGITAVAVRRFIAYCFEELGLDRVEAGVMRSNPASARVAEKAGLEFEGTAKQAYLKNGRRIDRLLYGLIRTEWVAEGDG